MVKSYFGDNLYSLRKQKGLSQDELAEMLSVSRQAISKWERNESYPDTENLIAISRFFDVNINDLINKSLDDIDKKNLTASESDEAKTTSTESDDEDGDSDEEIDIESSSSVSFWSSVPYSIAITIAYLLWGFLSERGWAIGWTLYVTIPVYYSIIDAIKHKSISRFNYAVFATFIFLLFGMIYGIWHPLWIVFLTVPIFDIIADSIDKNNKKQ